MQKNEIASIKTSFNLKKIIHRAGCHLEEEDPPSLSGSTRVVLRDIDVVGELLGTLRWGPARWDPPRWGPT